MLTSLPSPRFYRPVVHLLRYTALISSPLVLSACGVGALINDVDDLTETAVILVTNATSAPVRASSFSALSLAFATFSTETPAVPASGTAAFTGNALLAHSGPDTMPFIAHIGVAEFSADFATRTLTGAAEGFASNEISQAQYDALMDGQWTLVPGLFASDQGLTGETGTLVLSGGTFDGSGAIAITVSGTLDNVDGDVIVDGVLRGSMAGAEADSLSLGASTSDGLSVIFPEVREGLFQVFAAQ